MNAMRYEKNIVQPLTRNLQIAYMSQEIQDAEADNTMILLGCLSPLCQAIASFRAV